MAWAIIKMYISICAQMDPKQLPKTSKFYSRSKKCDIGKTLKGGYHPLGNPKVKKSYLHFSPGQKSGGMSQGKCPRPIANVSIKTGLPRKVVISVAYLEIDLG